MPFLLLYLRSIILSCASTFFPCSYIAFQGFSVLVFGLLRYFVLLFTTLCHLGSSSLIHFSPLFLLCQWFSCIFWLVDILLPWVFLPLRFLPDSPVVSACLSCSWISFRALSPVLAVSIHLLWVFVLFCLQTPPPPPPPRGVLGPSGASGDCSSVPFKSEGSTQTSSLPLFPPEPPHALPDCVSYIGRSAYSFGFLFGSG